MRNEFDKLIAKYRAAGNRISGQYDSINRAMSRVMGLIVKAHNTYQNDNIQPKWYIKWFV